ncbi:MAG: ABC-2 family transporter protein [Candidatus Micrarchaeota archaeon]
MVEIALIDSIRYYLINQIYAWKSFFAYRTESLLWLFYSAFTGIFSFITMTVIYNVSSGFPGWSYYQMLILSSTVGMVIAAIGYNVNSGGLIRSMRQGMLDVRMVKPYGLVTIMISISQSGALSIISSFASNLAIFAYAVLMLHLSLAYIITFLGIVAIGTYALIMFWLMLTVLSYHLFKSGMFMYGLINTLSVVGSYPLSIYGTIIMLLFSIIVPIGIAVYYPAELLLDKINVVFSIAIILFSLVLAFVSYKLFYMLMRHYTSGGG